jgi:hypothetical protein
LPDIANDTAARFLEYRTIKFGREAWEQVNKAESFEGWRRIGAALAIGKAHALRFSGANAPEGQNYCREFSTWAKEHGFGTMRASDRSYAIAFYENIGSITAWRATLSDRQRNRLNTAQGNVRRWRISTGQRCSHPCPGDLRRQATAAWRRFVAVMKLLPPGEAESLWQQSLFEMMQP